MGAMRKEEAYRQIEAIDREITLLGHIGAILEWDQELYAPAKASDERGRQMGYIKSRMHELATSPLMGEILEAVGVSEANPGGDASDPFLRALIRLRGQEYRKAHVVPSSLVAAISEETTKGYTVWVEARSKKDWKLFAPTFQRILDLQKERASCCRKPGQGLYDVLLDDYEEGASEAWIDALFAPLLAPVRDIIAHAPAIDDSFLRKTYPVEAQQALQREVMEAMGFDFSRGLVGTSAHPFTSTLGEEDVRITTRYTDPSVMDSFYSTVHESGHALYEQWASTGRQKGTTIAGGASYALHESQSRLWENIIGRSRPFLLALWPSFQKRFATQLEGIGFDQFYRAVNKVQPGCIRTNSDEVCYVLHIMLRYEIEKQLVKGSLSVDEVPEAWNKLSEQLLGIRPADDALGCLQDVHWAGGSIGYFPSYALGNLYGAQIWDALRGELDTDRILASGQWQPIVRWLGEHVWQYGMGLDPATLIKMVSGKALDATSFTRYLETKYKEM